MLRTRWFRGTMPASAKFIPITFQTWVNNGLVQCFQKSKDASRRVTRLWDNLYRCDWAKAEIWWATEASKADHSSSSCKISACSPVGGELTMQIISERTSLIHPQSLTTLLVWPLCPCSGSKKPWATSLPLEISVKCINILNIFSYVQSQSMWYQKS